MNLNLMEGVSIKTKLQMSEVLNITLMVAIIILTIVIIGITQS